MQPTNKTPDRTALWAVLFGLRPFFSSGKWHVRLNSHKQASGVSATGDTPLEAIMNFETAFDFAKPTVSKPAEGSFAIPIPLDVAEAFFGIDFAKGEGHSSSKMNYGGPVFVKDECSFGDIGDIIDLTKGRAECMPVSLVSQLKPGEMPSELKAKRLAELLKADARFKDVTLEVTAKTSEPGSLTPSVVVNATVPFHVSTYMIRQIIHEHNSSLYQAFGPWTDIRVNVESLKRSTVQLPPVRPPASQENYVASWEILSLLKMVACFKECTINIDTTFNTTPRHHLVRINGPSHFDGYRICRLAEDAIKTIGPVTNFTVQLQRGDKKADPAPTIPPAPVANKTYAELCAAELKKSIEIDSRLEGCWGMPVVKKSSFGLNFNLIDMTITIPYHLHKYTAEKLIRSKADVYAHRLAVHLDLKQGSVEQFKLRRRDDTGRPLRPLTLEGIEGAFNLRPELKACELNVKTHKSALSDKPFFDIKLIAPDHFDCQRITVLANRILAHEQFEAMHTINTRTRSQRLATTERTPPTPPVVEPISAGLTFPETIGRVVDRACKTDFGLIVELNKLAENIHAEIRKTSELDGRPLKVEVAFCPAYAHPCDGRYEVTVFLDLTPFESWGALKSFFGSKITKALGTNKFRLLTLKYTK